LLSAGAEATLHRHFASRQAFSSLPALHSLVGWGFRGAALQALASGCEFLAELSTTVGAGVSDWLLTCLATACPHLGALRLQFSTVSDSGVPSNRALTPSTSRANCDLCRIEGPPSSWLDSVRVAASK